MDQAILKQFEKIEDEMNDEHKLFCLSLVPKLKKLGDEQYENAQIRILQVIMEESRKKTTHAPLPASQMPSQRYAPSTYIPNSESGFPYTSVEQSLTALLNSN